MKALGLPLSYVYIGSHITTVVFLPHCSRSLTRRSLTYPRTSSPTLVHTPTASDDPCSRVGASCRTLVRVSVSVLCSTLDFRALVSGFDCDGDGALNFHAFVLMVYS